MRFRWLKKVWSINRQPTHPRPLNAELKYERFSDEGRKVMQLANQEAQRFNHEYIGTEHILLGLIKEGSCVAVFKTFGFELWKVRANVETLILRGPDVVTMGKLKQTPRAKNVIEYSIEEARNLNHNYVGPEHILLGLLREQEGVGGVVLTNFGLTMENARKEVMRGLSGKGSATNT
jgi:ATP-dependent Clp protease ATP-binding subunit ClpC